MAMDEEKKKRNQELYKKVYKHFPYEWAEEMTHKEFWDKTTFSVVGNYDLTLRKPLTMILEMIKENMSRPEIVAAYKAAVKRDPWDFDRDNIPDEMDCLPYYDEYLKYKYGDETMAYTTAGEMLIEIYRGKYSGPDDPKLIEELISRQYITDDRGEEE